MLPDFSFTDEASVVDSDTEQQDPELELVPPETEMCLNQELEALQQTGTWEHNQSIDTQVVEDTVEYDFPVVMNKQVQMYLDLFQGAQRKQFSRWLARSGKYGPLVQAELEHAGLPADLLYLSMIESGFNQRAYSKARAVGLWQFMSGTARQYGLRIDRYIDERRDAEKSTTAAIAYLADLYDEFGDWHLAVAAYNGGPGKVRKGLKRYKVNNFWDLAQHKHLRLETKRYVPKLIAAIIIARDPQKYGFTNIDYQKPLRYDTLEVGPGLSLEALALLSGSSKKEIKALNVELRKGKTPLNSRQHLARIPMGSYELAQKNMKRLHSYATTDYAIHIYRKGETLSAICRKYNINKTTLLKVNNIQSSTLADGTRLRIPSTTITYRLLPDDRSKALALKSDTLILHTVKKGETISKISRQYGVPASLIVSWNGLPSVHKIGQGQQLALYLSNNGKYQETAPAKLQELASPSKEIIVLAGSSKRLPASAEQTNHGVVWYKVKSGDSLWTISRQFRISPAQIKKWNNLKSSLIHPGVVLKINNA